MTKKSLKGQFYIRNISSDRQPRLLTALICADSVGGNMRLSIYKITYSNELFINDIIIYSDCIVQKRCP